MSPLSLSIWTYFKYSFIKSPKNSGRGLSANTHSAGKPRTRPSGAASADAESKDPWRPPRWHGVFSKRSTEPWFVSG